MLTMQVTVGVWNAHFLSALTFLATSLGAWLVPYVTGGTASTYRSEAFVIVCVPLLRELPS